MTDQEELDLAAKAAGYKSYANANKYSTMRGTDSWSPREDDGDAFRLAIKLRLFWLIESPFTSIEIDQSYEELRKATRRAIVRAAAEIGRNMK